MAEFNEYNTSNVDWGNVAGAVADGSAKTSDSLFKNLFGGIFNSSGTKECGARPTCVGWSEGCKQKQQQYYECTKVASESKAKVTSTIMKVAIIGACVIAGIVIVAITSRGSNNR